jgi:predicted RecA/RadA family phage recombinase
MSYSNPTSAVYRFPAATLSTAAIIGRIVGPAGKSGRLIDIGNVVTTGVTVAANTIDVGLTADVDAFGTLSVPVSSAGAVANGMTRGTDDDIPADTVVEVSTNGECTAGAGDVLVTIEWY